MPKEIGLVDASGVELVLFTLYKIVVRTGDTYRYTDCDQDLEVDVGDGDGRQRWSAAPGISRGDVRAGLDLQIDDLTVAVPNVDLTIGAITRPLAHWAKVRYFQGAQVEVYIYDHQHVAAALHSTWEIQAHTLTTEQVEFALEAFTAKLDVQIPRIVFQPGCNHALFDQFCAVDASLYDVTSTVAAGTPTAVTYGALTPSAPPAPASGYADGWFDQGEIIFTSGNLVGLRETIAQHLGSVVTPIVALPEAPDVGSTIVLLPGCLKRILDCRDKFGSNRTGAPTNWFQRFLGFPYMEEMEKTLGRGGSARFGGGAVGGSG